MIDIKLPTLLDTKRICNLVKYSDRASRVDDTSYFCEFGIYKGGSLEILSKLHPGKTIFGIDSFEGLPAPTNHDFHSEGEFGDVDRMAITGYFKTLYPNVRILKGFSPDVFSFFDEHSRFSFVHVDVDLYSSVLHACDFFYPRMVDGGIIVYDDYGFTSTPGSKNAIDEFYKDRSPKFKGEVTDMDGASNKQYLIIK